MRGSITVPLSLLGSLALLVWTASAQTLPTHPAPRPGSVGWDALPHGALHDEGVDRGSFEDRIAAVRDAYRAWPRFGDALRWAPWDCLLPPAALPRVSHTPEASVHGQKVYFVYARRIEAFDPAGAPQPIGQVLVKESWHPRAIAPGPHGAARYEPGDPRGLFVMMHLGADTMPGTDRGWIYGTVTPDGHVTSAGVVSSCAGCHDTVAHRVLPLSAPEGE